jgi:hypothetical protein
MNSDDNVAADQAGFSDKKKLNRKTVALIANGSPVKSNTLTRVANSITQRGHHGD